GPEASGKSRGEITRKFTCALYDVNEYVCTRNKPKKARPMPQTTASIHSNARASSNLPGYGRIMFHIVGCKIRNAGNVVIVDSFVLIVRGPETDSRSKSYRRLKILPRHQRGYPLVAWSGSIRKSRGEITRKFTWALYDVNEKVCTRNNPKKAPPMPQTTASIRSNARTSSNLPGCGRIIFHIVGCKIRNGGNVVIVDSFVLIVRGPETDSRSKSYGRLKILPRHQRGYPFGSLVRKHPENPVAKSPENLRGPSMMLMSRFAPEITRRKPLACLKRLHLSIQTRARRSICRVVAG